MSREARLSADAAFHWKMLAAGNAAVGAWLRALLWCRSQLTDGLIPAASWHLFGAEEELASLLRVRLLDACDGGYRIHDYADHYEAGSIERTHEAEAEADAPSDEETIQ